MRIAQPYNRKLAPQLEFFVSFERSRILLFKIAASLDFSANICAAFVVTRARRRSAHIDSRTSTDSIFRAAPASRSIPIAAVSANAVTPPMDPRDAIAIFSSAAYRILRFREACEALRNCDEADLFIRGLDARFRREIAETGSNSIRELLRAHFAKLPEKLCALSEYAIIESRETAQGVTLSDSGQREVFDLCRIRVRSYHAALTMAEIIRREFAARPPNEKPQILIVAHESPRLAETPLAVAD